MKFYTILDEDGEFQLGHDDHAVVYEAIEEAKSDMENYFEDGVWHIAEVNVVSTICIKSERTVKEL